MCEEGALVRAAIEGGWWGPGEVVTGKDGSGPLRRGFEEWWEGNESVRQCEADEEVDDSRVYCYEPRQVVLGRMRFRPGVLVHYFEERAADSDGKLAPPPTAPELRVLRAGLKLQQLQARLKVVKAECDRLWGENQHLQAEGDELERAISSLRALLEQLRQKEQQLNVLIPREWDEGKGQQLQLEVGELRRQVMDMTQVDSGRPRFRRERRGKMAVVAGSKQRRGKTMLTLPGRSVACNEMWWEQEQDDDDDDDESTLATVLDCTDEVDASVAPGHVYCYEPKQVVCERMTFPPGVTVHYYEEGVVGRDGRVMVCHD